MKIKGFLSFCLLLFLSHGLFSQANNEWNQKDANGLKFGAWKGFYPQGQLRYVGQFKNDLPVDTFYYYFEDGKIKSILIYDKDVANKALAMHFYSTGDTLAKGHYVDQKKEGMWMSYGESSVPVERGAYKDGQKNGRWIIYYPTGVISEEMHYANGIQDGPFKTYFENGQMHQDAFFLEGALHGQVTFYSKEGKKEQEGEYKQNLRDGKWLIYNENENVIKLYRYDNGTLLNPDDKDSLNYDQTKHKENRKDYLEFEDIRGKIKYD